MGATISLRPANLNDLNLLKAWDNQPHVIESDPNDDWNWEVELARQLPWREQLIGSPTDLGHGYGTAMMKLAVVRCFETPAVTAILIDPLVSNKRAHRFYERLGFQVVEDRMFGEDFCRVYSLTRDRFLTNFSIDTTSNVP